MKRKPSEAFTLKPIWKSVGFWLGAFVMLSLCWAWIDSISTRSWLSWHSYLITSENGALDFGVNEDRYFGRTFSMGREPSIPVLAEIPLIRELFFPLPRSGWVYCTQAESPNHWLQVGARWWVITLLWSLLWVPSFIGYRRWQQRKIREPLP